MYKDKERWCCRYERQRNVVRSVGRRLLAVADQISELKAAHMSPSVRYDGMPHAGSAGDSMSGYMAQLEILECRLESLQAQLYQERARLSEVEAELLACFAKNRDHALLRWRYINCWSYRGIAKRLCRSEVSVRRRVRKAVELLDESLMMFD